MAEPNIDNQDKFIGPRKLIDGAPAPVVEALAAATALSASLEKLVNLSRETTHNQLEVDACVADFFASVRSLPNVDEIMDSFFLHMELIDNSSKFYRAPKYTEHE